MNKHLPISNSLRQLEDEIQLLEKELDLVKQKVENFEASLRSHLIDQIIEERELYNLYKALKKEKKEKRKAQKQKGKNYKNRSGLLSQRGQEIQTSNPEEGKEKKRLYREAMLLVHPDKFSMEGEDNDTATAMTAKLIDIYKHQDLQSLQDYHAYIISGATALPIKALKNQSPIAKEVYLEKEKEKLHIQLEALKKRRTYRVLQEYSNPIAYAAELKAYYSDRIAKLKKRTRKANV